MVPGGVSAFKRAQMLFVKVPRLPGRGSGHWHRLHCFVPLLMQLCWRKLSAHTAPTAAAAAAAVPLLLLLLLLVQLCCCKLRIRPDLAWTAVGGAPQRTRL
jgi:hypothetical protein